MESLRNLSHLSQQLDSPLTRRQRAMKERSLKRKYACLQGQIEKYQDHSVVGDSIDHWLYLWNYAKGHSYRIELQNDTKVQIDPWDLWVEGLFGHLYSTITFTLPFQVIIYLSWDDNTVSGDSIFAYKTAYYVVQAFPRVEVFILTNKRMEKWLNINVDLPRHVYVRTCPEAIYPKGWDPHGIPLIVLDVATPSSQHLKLLDTNGDLRVCKRYIHIDEFNGWRTLGKPLCHPWISTGLTFTNEGALCGGIHIRCPPIKPPKMFTRDFYRAFPGKMYFGYNSRGDNDQIACEYLDNFFAALVIHGDLRTDDFNIVIIERNGGSVQSEFLERNWKFLKQFRYKIKIYQNWQHRLSQSWSPKTRKRQKVIRVFFFDRFPHNDVLWLMKNSERLVMTTGDQSTAEAISFDKIIVSYQIQPWKEEFITGLLSVLHQTFGGTFFCDLGYMIFDQKTPFCPHQMGVLLSQPSLYHDATRFNELIRRRYDFFPYLKSMINCRLWGDISQINRFKDVPIQDLGKELVKYGQTLKEKEQRPAKRMRYSKNTKLVTSPVT